jgi:hypothetical protein
MARVAPVDPHDATRAARPDRPNVVREAPAERPTGALALPPTGDWQHAACEAVPELTEVIRAGWSVHVLFTELLGLVRAAHTCQDTQTLRRAYGFAAWCLRAPGAFLANAALVSFYELLFEDWAQRERVVAWLPPEAVEKVWPLWEWRFTAPALAEIDRLLAKHQRARPA